MTGRHTLLFEIKQLAETKYNQSDSNPTGERCLDVAVVIVTFNPIFETLQSTIRALAGQAKTIFIVDNASINPPQSSLCNLTENSSAELEIVIRETNTGLGAAYNLGIMLARKQGAKFVLLLDQDSEISAHMIAILCRAYEHLTTQGLRVAAIGPRYRDSDHGTPSQFTRIGLFKLSRIPCNTESSVVETDFIVSSGSLIPLSAVDVIGGMDEQLFIDHVDTEWCLRAKAKGFRVYGACSAIMKHCLGERRTRFWLIRWRIVPFHAPFRYYYIFRNSILLYQRGYIPLNWKIADLGRCLTFVIFFGICAPNRLDNLKMMWRGIRDGLKGIHGQLV